MRSGNSSDLPCAIAVQNALRHVSRRSDSPPVVMRGDVAATPEPPSAAPPMPVAMKDGQIERDLHAALLHLGAQGVKEAVQRMLGWRNSRCAPAAGRSPPRWRGPPPRPRRASSWGSAAWVICMAPKKLTSMTRRSTAGSVSCEQAAMGNAGVVDQHVQPPQSGPPHGRWRASQSWGWVMSPPWSPRRGIACVVAGSRLRKRCVVLAALQVERQHACTACRKARHSAAPDHPAAPVMTTPPCLQTCASDFAWWLDVRAGGTTQTPAAEVSVGV